MNEEEVFRQRDLPYWDVPGAVYFVTSCFFGKGQTWRSAPTVKWADLEVCPTVKRDVR
jgi:hypothetical protein